MKRLCLLAAVLSLVLAASAFAATVEYRGKTAQGRKASGRVVDGRLKLFKIAWKVSCDHADPWADRTTWTDTPEGPIEHDGSRFSDSGKLEVKVRDGRLVYTLKLSGEISGERLKGKTTIRIRFYNTQGKHADNCRGTIRFDIPNV